ncbi:hypothetical protein BG261_05460 [Floricoccus tropicus]|uniref:Uncharacterized protein n=1 Tax=Floricoccus tropicus TaxID=1859473 RepID=A0A1E8GKY3_9LACT|nr:hypothetical protein [Floricoccus tropicus]OFI48837.1 hypothetical protein BG261_05460 [Floricoccus tropicus]
MKLVKELFPFVIGTAIGQSGSSFLTWSFRNPKIIWWQKILLIPITLLLMGLALWVTFLII